MSGINPQGVDVISFKAPNSEELAHDFLWRVNKNLPVRGKIGIFNRSHYEDVFFKKRYSHIRNYEEYLHDNSYRIVKIFLNISKDEQKKRFLERIDTPEKNWKFDSGALKERAL